MVAAKLASAARVIVVVRQTEDWEAIANGTATHDASAFDALTGRPDGFTAGLIRFWNRVSGPAPGFFRARARMTEVAAANWSRVAGASFLPVADFKPPFDALAMYAFTDDDDWFAPSLVDMLLQSDARTADGAVWRSARFNGSLQLRENTGFCYTNNYAVHGSLFSRVPAAAPRSIQHMDADSLLHGSDIRLEVIDHPLSVTNKHPCSFNTLENASERGSVLSLLEPYSCYLNDPIATPAELRWAKPYMDDVAHLFAGGRAA